MTWQCQECEQVGARGAAQASPLAFHLKSLQNQQKVQEMQPAKSYIKFWCFFVHMNVLFLQKTWSILSNQIFNLTSKKQTKTTTWTLNLLYELYESLTQDI